MNLFRCFRRWSRLARRLNGVLETYQTRREREARGGSEWLKYGHIGHVMCICSIIEDGYDAIVQF